MSLAKLTALTAQEWPADTLLRFGCEFADWARGRDTGENRDDEFQRWRQSHHGGIAARLLVGRAKQDVEDILYQETELSRTDVRLCYSDSSYFGTRMYNEASRNETEEVGKAIQVGIDNGWLVWDQQKESFTMHSHNDDLTTLMWQVALTNWETTKKELSLPQVVTMARISLHALGNAALPGSAKDYHADQVTKALEKATTVINELNDRMRAEKGRLLAESSQ